MPLVTAIQADVSDMQTKVGIAKKEITSLATTTQQSSDAFGKLSQSITQFGGNIPYLDLAISKANALKTGSEGLRQTWNVMQNTPFGKTIAMQYAAITTGVKASDVATKALTASTVAYIGVATVGLGAVAVVAYTIVTEMQSSKDLMESINQDLEQTSSLMDRIAERTAKISSEQKSFVDSLRTPDEIYQAEIDKINSMKNARADMYNDALLAHAQLTRLYGARDEFLQNNQAGENIWTGEKLYTNIDQLNEITKKIAEQEKKYDQIVKDYGNTQSLSPEQAARAEQKARDSYMNQRGYGGFLAPTEQEKLQSAYDALQVDLYQGVISQGEYNKALQGITAKMEAINKKNEQVDPLDAVQKQLLKQIETPADKFKQQMQQLASVANRLSEDQRKALESLFTEQLKKDIENRMPEEKEDKSKSPSSFSAALRGTSEYYEKLYGQNESPTEAVKQGNAISQRQLAVETETLAVITTVKEELARASNNDEVIGS